MPATLEKNRLDRCVESQNEDLEQILFEDLSRRLDCLWRYDQYIANAGGRPELQEFWRGTKSQEQKNIDRLKMLIKQHVKDSCF